MPAPAGYGACLKKVSLIYFGSEAKLSQHETYVQLPVSLRKPSMLFLNFFPLPWKLEQKWYGRSIIEAHHQARVHLISHMIPHGRSILDLGGGDAVQCCGALLAMGYAKEPERLHIIDLPPRDRIHDPTTLGEINELQVGPTKVQYDYRSMADLEHLPDQSFDLIWMGQTIEHITSEDLLKVLNHSRRVLTKEGRFCLDTPNRKITKLLDPKNYIHPDHKIEYEWQELSDLIESNGFVLEVKKAITPLPLSLESGLMHRLEFLTAPMIGDEPENGFSFYLQFKKVD